MLPYEGILTAMVTPFDAELRVDEEAAIALGRHLLANGSHGLVVCGTTGEAATLADDEHLSMIRTMAAELGDEGAIVGGTGSNDTRHACHMTEAAAEAGVDAILSVAPYYNKPNRRGLVRHYSEVARAAGDTPVILYNIPGRSVINMPPDLLAELGQIDNIVAVKEANPEQLQPIDGLVMLAGNDFDVARCLDFGGGGGICVASHIVGPQMREMYDDPTRRAEIDASLQDVYEVLFITSSPICCKAALNLLGHQVGGLRLPLVEADENELDQVRGVLERHGLLEAAAR